MKKAPPTSRESKIIASTKSEMDEPRLAGSVREEIQTGKRPKLFGIKHPKRY